MAQTGNKKMNMPRNFWSYVGVSEGGMLHTALTLERSVFISSKEGDGWLFNSTLSTIEHKVVFTSYFHQHAEVSVMFFSILAMGNDIICNFNHIIIAVKYLVHNALEDILCTGQDPGEVNKMVSSPWFLESCQQE